LLLTLVKSKIKRKWAFANMVSLIGQQLMGYINVYRFLEDPEVAGGKSYTNKNRDIKIPVVSTIY
jgi:hypothetical protein